jgi:hypothetical protein
VPEKSFDLTGDSRDVIPELFAIGLGVSPCNVRDMAEKWLFPIQGVAVG